MKFYLNLLFFNISVPSLSPNITNVSNKELYCSPVKISWAPIPCSSWNGPLDYYKLSIDEIGAPMNSSSLIYQVHTSYALITGLKHYTQYRVQVARVNIGNRIGPFSSETNFTTSECCE